MKRRARSAIAGVRQSTANDLYQAGKCAAIASQLIRDGNLPDAVAQAHIGYSYLFHFLAEYGETTEPKPCRD